MPTRRDALRFSGGLLLASVVPRPLLACQPRTESQATAAAPARLCAETHANIEGPYYRPGAPERASLVDPGTAGTPLVIEGRVLGPDCSGGLARVELDVWHATHDGHYDNDGTMPGERMLLRGRVRTDADGRYRVSTIVPGRYLNGARYRPAHVHVKLRGDGFAPLTTQLYFPGDPYNDADPFIHHSLIMAVDGTNAGKRARFDFVLRRA